MLKLSDFPDDSFAITVFALCKSPAGVVALAAIGPRVSGIVER
jgi:hypothetical protein